MFTQRLGSYTEKDERFIDSLIEAIKSNPGSCDEVWLASDYGFPKLETHRQTARLLKAVSQKFRRAGIRVSLQISNTIGHGQYMRSMDNSGLVYAGSPVEKLTGSDGRTADYCFCWNGSYFREYVLEAVRAYAEIQPDCVWIDDDLRANHHDPVDFGCFCEDCIGAFNKAYGADFSREQLVYQINYGDLIWRERYVAFVRSSLGEFTYLVYKEINAVSPESYAGYQYCAFGGLMGHGFNHIFDAMRRATGKNPKSRPGGGAYSGHNPNEFLMKAYFINWQNVMLPKYVAETRPEIENLPDVVFGKSIANTCFETSLYLANGNTSISYAMLMENFESMAWHSCMLHQFSLHRPFWQKLIEANQGTTAGGLKIAYSKSMWKRAISESEPPFSWCKEPYLSGFELWSCTAIPICYSSREGGIYLLHPDQLAGFTDEEILCLLNRPVITDGKSIEVLEQRGFTDAVGVSVLPVDGDLLYEEYTAHAINDGFCGNRQWMTSFCPGAYHHVLIDKDGTTEPIGCYASHAEQVRKLKSQDRVSYGIANAVVKTKMGAAWGVFGHYLWNPIISLDKRNQILATADYLLHHEIPAILESPIQAVLLPRENDEKKVTSVSIINTTVGDTGEMTLRIRRPVGEKFIFMTPESGEAVLPHQKEEGEYSVRIPSLKAWSIGTVFIRK